MADNNDMNRKYIGGLFIVLGLIILALIIFFIFFYDFGQGPQPTPQAGDNKNTLQTSPDQKKTPAASAQMEAAKKTVISRKDMKESDLKRLASSFAERFGTYSNQSDMSNINDLKIFMSQKMQLWADNYIEEQRKKVTPEIYYGITTKAVVGEVKDFSNNEEKAQVLVRTQRKESTGSTNNFSYLQEDLLINFVKENGAWKIDSAFWQKPELSKS
jgi:hypothetical protein